MKRSLAAITALLAGFLLAPVALAGDDMTSLSYISYLERYATIRPAHGDATYDVVVNMPVLAGDRLDTSRGARVEVQLADGGTLWLDEFATVDFDAVALSSDDTSTRTALYLPEGTAAIEIPATAAGDGSLRFDSPAGAVFLNRPGLYRLELRGNEIRVQAHTGFAELPAGIGSEILRGGEEAVVGAESEIQRASITDASDDFWTWVQERRHVPTSRTAQYVDARGASRAAVLDSYGDWVYVPSFSSYMWQPRVSVGWVPYSYGRWYWTPVGYSWISYEPWGWYPFHYGSWYFDAGFGWVWGYDSVWGPAWVNWFYTPGYVGWCPRGYYDYWYYRNCNRPWDGHGPHPPRWNEVSFKFAGRARLDQIDPKPWTVVPSGNFSSLHIDRVRLDARRFLREGQPDREALVRSGPLVMPFPGRTQTDRNVESFFGNGPGAGSLPDLTSVLRREIPSGVRSAAPLPDLRSTRTRDVAAAVRSGADHALPIGPGGATTVRLRSRDARREPMTTTLPNAPRYLVVPKSGTTSSEGSSPSVVRREIVRSVGQPKPIEGGSNHAIGGSTVERHTLPSPPKPPSNSVSLNREFGSSSRNVASFQERWAAPVVRRDLVRAGTGASGFLGLPPRSTATESVRSVRYHAPDRSVTAHTQNASSQGSTSHGASYSGSGSHSSPGSGGSSDHGHRP